MSKAFEARLEFWRITMSTNANIQSMLEDVERIFQAAHTTISGMQQGARKQIKELAQDVGVAVGRDPKEVLAFVNHFAHNTDIAYVTRGKNGGVIKGTKPIRVVKVKVKKAKDPTETDTASASE